MADSTSSNTSLPSEPRAGPANHRGTALPHRRNTSARRVLHRIVHRRHLECLASHRRPISYRRCATRCGKPGRDGGRTDSPARELAAAGPQDRPVAVALDNEEAR